MRVIAMLAFVCACGRIGYDARPDAGDDLTRDGCPEGTTTIAAGSTTCIELDQRGSDTWIDATVDCGSFERRLCTDAEWFTACTNASGLARMLDDWEWVAEEAAGVAQKRGAGDCTGMSTHEITTDAYGYRCCVDQR